MHIDDLFRDKLKDRDFEFDDQAWKAAEKMLEADAAPTAWYAGKPALTGFAILVLGGAALTIGLMPSDNNMSNSQMAEVIVTSNETDENNLGEEVVDAEDSAVQTTSDDNTTSDENTVSDDVEATEEIKTYESNETTDISPVSVQVTNRKDVAETIDQIPTQDLNGLQKEDRTEHSLLAISEEPSIWTGRPEIIVHERVNRIGVMPWGQFYDDIDNLENTDHKYKKHWLKKTTFGLLIGANVEQGFLNGNVNRDGMGLGPVGGIKVSYLLGSMVSLEANILYHSRDGLNSQFSGFDESGAYFKTFFASLHYLDIPVYLNYRRKRHGVQIGLQYSKLLFAIENRETTINTPAGSTGVEETKNIVAGESFSPTDMAIMVGYEYVLNETINVGARFGYGLTDITEESSYKNTISDQNIGFRLYCEYKLFKY